MSWEIATLSIAAGFLLRAFYGMIRTDWPMKYMSVDSRVDPVTRRSMPRYLAFRFFPVYFTCLFVAVTVERWNGPAAYSLLVLCSVYLLSTSGWALLTTGSGHIGPKSLLFWLGAIPIVGGAALAAYWTKGSLAGLIPRPSEVASDFWTAVFTATLTALALNALRTPDDSIYEQVERTRTEIPRRYEATVRSNALKYDADENLLFAVMFTENIQRPKWIRTIENTVGHFVKNQHTYGIMQAPAARPISDEESIEIVASRFFLGSATVLSSLDGYEKDVVAISYLGRFNSNQNFLDFAGEIYSGLQYGGLRPL